MNETPKKIDSPEEYVFIATLLQTAYRHTNAEQDRHVPWESFRGMGRTADEQPHIHH